MPPLEAGVRELLEGAPLAHVATLMPDGSPHSVARVRRGRGRSRREGPDAFRVIDRISEKYTGAPHPVRDDRVLFLVESDRSWSQAFG